MSKLLYKALPVEPSLQTDGYMQGVTEEAQHQESFIRTLNQ